jgi:hypothetical protein
MGLPEKQMQDAKFRKALRSLRANGQTPAQIWDGLRSGRNQAAKEQGWRTSELAMAMAIDYTQMEIVFGKKTMDRIRNERKTNDSRRKTT